MKWNRAKGRKDRHVIDARGSSPSARTGGGGGLGGLPIPSGVAGIGGGAGVVVVIVILAITLLGGGGGSSGFDLGPAFGADVSAPGSQTPVGIPPDEDPQRDLKEFSTFVFNDAQDMWSKLFRQEGAAYRPATLYLYANAVRTDGCGSATSSVGPFYCPADQRVYLDLSFYDDMKRQLGASGDFAWAYVIAHELGHHVQNLRGTEQQVAQLTRDDPGRANDLSVRTELQADCYAGVWASTVFRAGDLERGDIEEAFSAAEAVGDDRLQRQAGRSVNPDTFTHGSSEQRRRWFDTGYESADPSACDTFSVAQP
jgi:hypothetical protein